jgi:hypothetical protein
MAIPTQPETETSVNAAYYAFNYIVSQIVDDPAYYGGATFTNDFSDLSTTYLANVDTAYHPE